MERVLLNISRTEIANPISRVRPLVDKLSSTEISKDIIFLGYALAFLQILDGLLTAIGVAHLGTEIEGNFLLRYVMESIGYIPALVVIKTIALGIIVSICFLSTRVSWLGTAMKAIIAIYIGLAVIPWTFIIAKHIL